MKKLFTNKIRKFSKGITYIMLFLCAFVTNAQIQPGIPGPGEAHELKPKDPHKVDEFYADAIDFLQGEGVLESWFTESFLPLYDVWMQAEYSKYIQFGQVLAGLAALVYLGWIGWGMLSGDKEWEILPILKPFGILFILMFWVQFCGVIRTPLKYLEESAKSDFIESQEELNALRIERFKYQSLLIDAVFEHQAEAHAQLDQQQQADQNLIEQGMDWVGDQLIDMVTPIYELYLRLQVNIQLVIGATLEAIGIWILRIAVYGLFFVQLMFITIMIMVGPIAAAMSIFPSFSQSFSSWIAKFINVNLWGFMAFIVLKLGTLLQRFAYEAEIERYLQIITTDGQVKNTNLLLTVLGSGTFNFGLVIVTFVISAIGVLMTPTLANYVVNAGSNSTAASKAKRAGMAVASGGKSLIFKR